MKAELVEEVNAEVYTTNADELEACFDKGLASDGGEYWITGHTIVEALTKAGYIIVKVEVTP